MVGVTGSIPVAPTISRPEKSANAAHCDNCGGASSRLNKPRTVPRCLRDLGTAWAKRSRKVLDGPLNAKRPASAEAHERSKSKSRETNGKRRNPARASRNHVPTKNSPKECAACGVQFRLQRSTARFCSPRCRNRHGEPDQGEGSAAVSGVKQQRRRHNFSFDAKRRQEIVLHARHVGAMDTEDRNRWLIAWVWHNPGAKDQIWSVMECAKNMGGKITEAEASVQSRKAASRAWRRRSARLPIGLQRTGPKTSSRPAYPESHP